MPTKRTKTALLLALPGALLFALHAAGIVPLALLAAQFSPRGEISAAFRDSLAHAQSMLGLSLLIAAAASPFIGTAAQKIIAAISAARLRTILIFIAALAFLGGLASQELIFGGVPHVTDATSHLFQAKIFALGLLHAPLPPVHDAFFQFQVYMTKDARWFTAYPPGTALYYAPFTALGLNRIAVPLAFAGLAAAITWLVARFFGQLRAALVGLLFICSPLALLLAGSYMSHIPLMFFSAAGLAFAIASLDKNPTRWLPTLRDIAAGIFLGWAAITRPQDFFLVAVFVLIALILWPKLWLPAFRLGIRMIPGLAIPALVQLGWNTHVFGSPLAIGYGRTNVGSLTPLLVPHWGLTDAFTLRDALLQTFHTLLRFDPVILGWPTALLLLPLAFFRRPDRRDILCLLALAAVIAFHFPYAYYGAEYEARFYALTLPFVLLLLTRALESRTRAEEFRATTEGAKSTKALQPPAPSEPSAVKSESLPSPHLCKSVSSVVKNPNLLLPPSEPFEPLVVKSEIPALFPALIVAFSLYGVQHTWPRGLLPTYGNDYEQATPALHQLAQRTGLTNALVLIDTSPPNDFRYTSAFPHNDPLLKNPILYARHLPGKERELAAAFPTRKLYLYVPGTTHWSAGTFQRLEISAPDASNGWK